MKRIVLLVVTCVALVANGADKRDLILIAGQSNAVGFDAKPEELPEDERDREVMFWFKVGDPPPDEHDSMSDGWTHLRPHPLGNPKKPRKDRQYGNFAQPSGGFGPEFGLARTLLDRGTAKLAIVKAAFSGTGIGRDWNPRSEGADGSCYRALMAETRKAIAAAKEQGIELRLRAFVWVQGESDANSGNVHRYAGRMAKLVAALRKDLQTPDLIALLAVNTRFLEDRNKFMPYIVASQREVAAKDRLAAYVDTSKCTIANRVHFDSKGTLEMGRLFAEKLLNLENGR